MVSIFVSVRASISTIGTFMIKSSSTVGLGGPATFSVAKIIISSLRIQYPTMAIGFPETPDILRRSIVPSISSRAPLLNPS